MKSRRSVPDLLILLDRPLRPQVPIGPVWGYHQLVRLLSSMATFALVGGQTGQELRHYPPHTSTHHPNRMADAEGEGTLGPTWACVLKQLHIFGIQWNTKGLFAAGVLLPLSRGSARGALHCRVMRG